jgi:glucosamine--fructose-6-phosphate aminotransferase (isomerizing)
MGKEKRNDANTLALKEICEQPQALNELIDFYSSRGGQALLQSAYPLGPAALFTGMGASFHAAEIGSGLCCHAGINARAVETCDLLDWPAALLAQYDPIIYISQSGASGEVEPLLKKAVKNRLIAITNDPQSPLGEHAALTLPLHAGVETLMASKTYLNSLALVWRITRSMAGGDEAAMDDLKRVRQRLQVLIEARESLMERWQMLLDGSRKLILLGGGLQAISARQASLMLAEWAKVPSHAFSFDAFKHGFIEIIDKTTTVIAFEDSSHFSQEWESKLQWMAGIGTEVIRVRDGFPQALGNANRPPAAIGYGLSPILDAAAAQLLAVQLAQVDGVEGFRYLSKVVS